MSEVAADSAGQRSDVVGGILYSVFNILPKNLMSYVVGFVFRIRLPRPLNTWINKGFVALFGIDMSEAELKISDYGSIEDVFSRTLRPDVRPIESELCIPCDGQLVYSRSCEKMMALQVKGISYPLDHLVSGNRPFDNSMELNWFSTIYLAPSNYHRVHSAVTGKLLSINYIPGDLWPVNPPFVKLVPSLFNKNERLVFEIAPDKAPAGRVFIVMVGALNVGRIETSWLPVVVANSFRRQFVEQDLFHSFELPPQVKAGDELGTFLLGSTTVVVFDKIASDEFDISSRNDEVVRMGQPL